MVHSLYALQNIDIDSYFALDHPNQICIEDVGEMVALIVEYHYLQSPHFEVSSVCAGLVSCTKLRALKLDAQCTWRHVFLCEANVKPSRIGLTLVPNIVNLRQVGF